MGQWRRVRDADQTAVDRLAGALGLLPVTARCLVARGIEDEAAARDFLGPRLSNLRPPAGLTDLPVAVARIVKAVRARERIGVFGDYDVDGITTCALLSSFLREVGAACLPRVARRDAGYGFGMADVAHFADAGCTLIVTGDCGTSDVEAIAQARSMGIDVVVVDHHTVPDASSAHPAVALVNPLRTDSSFPFEGMASVGLAFYLAASVRTALKEARYFNTERPEPDVKLLLDLVAVGTIADLVPLREENRVLTAAGLKALALRARPGLNALLAVAGVDVARPIDEHTIGWKLSPRLNAPGRLGDAQPALGLLLARDAVEAGQRAQELEQANERRREVQAEVFEQAVAAVDETALGSAIVLSGEGWPSGVVGIVAAKLVERFGRTAFVIAVDEHGVGRGSARAVPGVNLYDALHACAEHLDRYGGHAAAAGLTVQRDNLDALRAGLEAAVAGQIGEGGGAAQPGPEVDGEVELREVCERMAEELAELAPFGKQNDEPVLLCRRVTVVESRRVGDEEQHLKLVLEDGDGNSRDAIAFRMGERDPGQGAVLDVVFTPEINEWNGQRSAELTVRDFQVC